VSYRSAIGPSAMVNAPHEGEADQKTVQWIVFPTNGHIRAPDLIGPLDRQMPQQVGMDALPRMRLAGSSNALARALRLS
jgi:hypothetical protein